MCIYIHIYVWLETCAFTWLRMCGRICRMSCVFPHLLIFLDFRVPPNFPSVPVFLDFIIFHNFQVPPNFPNVHFFQMTWFFWIPGYHRIFPNVPFLRMSHLFSGYPLSSLIFQWFWWFSIWFMGAARNLFCVRELSWVELNWIELTLTELIEAVRWQF